jgi:lipopolysaccharide transport system permease protein
MPIRKRELSAVGRALHIGLEVENDSRQVWTPDSMSVGYQLFDPESGRFIEEGKWTPLPREAPPGGAVDVEVVIEFPREPGGYRIYVSLIDHAAGWTYTRGEPFLLIEAVIDREKLTVIADSMTTVRALKRAALRRAIPKAFTFPVRTIVRNRRLIRSMARRDILARYRGSLGDVFWTVLNPLLLMLTYFFVFGVVLHARFGADQSSTGFALYFLAGMLPWLAFSEPVGRSPHVILEHRNFVKKLIFPLETLPVNQVVAGFVTELFALAVFVIALIILRGAVPASVVWLPVILIPQLLFTLGMCWFLAALGAFVRDLGQIMGFLLTLWFFVTPICYSEASLPKAALPLLAANPLFTLVGAYRAIFLENRAPDLRALTWLWVLSLVVFLCGHAWFHKLRKTFADVI